MCRQGIISGKKMTAETGLWYTAKRTCAEMRSSMEKTIDLYVKKKGQQGKNVFPPSGKP